MSHRDDLIRLRHMLDHAVEAVEMVQGRTRGDLDRDRQLNLALVRLLEIVGEAASKVSNEFRSLHPSIPWVEISGLRNRLIHGYDAVDFDILWEILHHDLPPLIMDLRLILEARIWIDPRFFRGL
jgi:uncharacterized protein with HEPN domain